MKPGWKIAGAALLAALLVPLLNRSFGIPSEYWSVVIGIAAVYAAMALSLNFMLGHAGLVSLGHAGFIGLGAFGSGFATVHLELPMAVGVVLAGCVAACAALLLGTVVRRLEGISVAIGTIAFAVLVEESIFAWEGLTGGRAGIAPPRPMVGNFTFDNEADYAALLLIGLAGVLALDINLAATKLGRAMHAIRWSRPVAATFGIGFSQVQLAAIVLAGASAGIAGSLYAHLVGLVNAETFAVNAQQNLSLVLVMLVVLGGAASRGGILVAATFFAIGPVLLSPLRAWEFVIGGALLMFAVVRHPSGLGELFRRPAIAGALPARIELPPLPSAVGTGPRLELEDVTVSFGAYKALDGVSVTVSPGRLHGLIGPNGAGKSTLLNAVAGTIRYTGQILVDGVAVDHLAPHERAGLAMCRTFQGGGLIGDVSVRENLLLAMHSKLPYRGETGLVGGRRVRRAESLAAARVERAAELLGLADRLDERAGILSIGQQRVVEIARALLIEPRLLLLDEPTSGLSLGAADAVVQHLKGLKDARVMTIIVVDHSDFINDVCDSVTALEAGEVIVSAEPQEVAKDPRVAAYLGAV